MSVHLTTVAWKCALQPTPKLVLLYLADLADMNDRCSPSIADLAAFCGVTRMCIFQALKKLEAAGMIERQQRGKATNVYTLMIGPY